MYTIKLPLIFQPFTCNHLVRLGKDFDGGYLVDEHSIRASDLLLSLGIGQDWSFEQDFLKINDCDFVAFDQSVDCTTESYADFFVGKRLHKKINVGPAVGQMPMLNVLNNIHQRFFLKCDIEGDEYHILHDIINFSRYCSGMVIEFHNINHHDNFNKLTNFIGKIPLKLVHIHVNNYMYYRQEHQVFPDVVELSFSSNDHLIFDQQIILPHKLDMPNNVNDQEFCITF